MNEWLDSKCRFLSNAHDRFSRTDEIASLYLLPRHHLSETVLPIFEILTPLFMTFGMQKGGIITFSVGVSEK